MNEGCRLYTQRTEQGAVVVYLNNNHIFLHAFRVINGSGVVMAQHITQNHLSLNFFPGKIRLGLLSPFAKRIKPILGFPHPSTASLSIRDCDIWDVTSAILCGDESFDLPVFLR